MAENADDPALDQWKPKHLQARNALSTIDKKPEIKDNGDPAPTQHDATLERMNGLVNDVTVSTLNELRELRDDVDNLIRVIQTRNLTIQKAFAEHISFSQSTIHCKNIIKETLGKIHKDFQNGMEPIPKNLTIGNDIK